MSSDIDELMDLLRSDDRKVYIFYWNVGLVKITLHSQTVWEPKHPGSSRGMNEYHLASTEPIIAEIIEELKTGGAARKDRIYSPRRNEWIIYRGND